MTRRTHRTPAALAVTGLLAWALSAADAPKPGLDARTPWTTSRVKGTPEPPPAFRVERAFPKLAFNNPILMTNAPGTGRLFVGEQGGKIVSFPEDQAVAKPDPFLDLPREVPGCRAGGNVKQFGALYGLTFHPKFAENRYCYVCYALETTEPKKLRTLERVSRFTVTAADPPRCDPKSEKVILSWMTEPGGHNGGCLCFGPDGYLYVSMGDAADPSPPDQYDTGQDLGDLLSSILRIDVDRAEGDRPYAVPADNPFVKTPGARPENWAYGFRNPWKMSFDRATGDLWVGDVGWELWELVYRVQKGGNYGWSVKEGPQWVKPNGKLGPTPILPPALAFPHTEGASVTGGFVYRGKRFPDLVGSYVCGDWMTGRVWGTRFDGDRVVSHRVIAHSRLKIITFAETNDGELYLMDYAEPGGAIYQLVPNPAAQQKAADFPHKLSETGVFASVAEHRPAAGVVPFSVNAVQWMDHATAERFVALPSDSTVRLYDEAVPVPGTAFYRAKVFFPKDGVLVRTISLELERGNPASRRRLETQLLHFDGDDWQGYSYRWNDAQTDAELVPAGGAEQTFEVRDAGAPGGKRRQTWRFAGRGECFQCHNPWAGTVLAFTPAQLDRPHDYGGRAADQLETLRHVGLVTPVTQEGKPKPAGASFKAKLHTTDPRDEARSLDDRARSYLHANCSHCHQPGAGGTAQIDLRFDTPLAETKALGVPPAQGTFDLRDGQLIAPGDPYRSVIYYRMAKLGPGRMPHIGSSFVDERGLRLVHDWIAQLPAASPEQALLEKVCAAKVRAAERSAAIDKLLSGTTGALMLLRAMDAGRVPEAVRQQVVAAAMARPDGQVRDLFERFVPDEQRVKRLGTTINPDVILGIEGDAGRGKEVFFKTAGLQCATCHKVAGTGGDVGPDLGQVGKKYTRAQLLTSLLDPSKDVDPQFAAYNLEATDGKVFTGLLVSKGDKEVVLRDAQAKEVRVPAGKVATLAPQAKSLMPEQLLRDLTAEQAADLVAYLESLK